EGLCKEVDKKNLSGTAVDAESLANCELARKWIVDAKASVDSIADEVTTKLESNLEIIEGYYDNFVLKVQEVEEFFESLPDKLKEISEEISDYFGDWLEETKEKINDWADFRNEVRAMLLALEIVPDFFTDFTASCSSCNVSRGTVEELLIKIFLSAVIDDLVDTILDKLEDEFPRIADIIIDLSDLSLGLDVSVPQIELEPSELALFELPELPTFETPSFDLSVSLPEFSFSLSLDSIPDLPEFESFEIDFPEVNAEFPELFTVPDAPEVPDLVSSFTVLINIVRPFYTLFCLLKMGYFTVPEWYLKAYVEQLTNRLSLFSFDFVLDVSLVGDDSDDSELEPTVIKMDMDFLTTITDGEEIAQAVADYANCNIQKISNSLETDETGDTEECEFKVETSEIALEHPISTERLLVDAGNEEFSKSIQASQNVLAQKIKNAEVDEKMQRNVAVLGTMIANKKKNWVASLENVNMSLEEMRIPENLSIEEEEEPGIYKLNSNGTIDKVATGTEGARMSVDVLKTEGNTGEDILYSIGDSLFTKTSVESIKEDDEDDEPSVKEIDYSNFEANFLPVKSISTEVQATGVQVKFVPEDSNYYELIFSDRPDTIFEVSEDADDRISENWDRKGFLILPEISSYAVRDFDAKISDLSGNPIMYTVSNTELESFSEDDCNDEDVQKPFFADEVQLISNSDSRMWVRVPPRGNQEEDLREIVLKEGEETKVEYAEICVTRGDVEVVGEGSSVLTEAEEGQFVSNGTRFELDDNDEMTIQIFDGTEINIYGGETYSIEFFTEGEDEEITSFEYLDQGNSYGVFLAYSEDGEKSVILSKFVFDPQKADDTRSPSIVIKGGTNLYAQMFKKILVDASGTFDEQSLEEVWWDFAPDYDADGDGDATNDNDFPKDIEYAAADLLKILLPEQDEAGEFEIVINVQDVSGNVTSEIITINVEAPNLELFDASARSQNVLGKVEGDIAEIPVSFYRTRDGRTEILDDVPVFSDADGKFEVTDLSNSGGVEIIHNSTKEVMVEILETGRPVIINDEFGFKIESASILRPFRLKIRDKAGRPIAFVVFERGSEVTVEVEDLDGFTANNVENLEGVHVLDRNTGDNISFIKFSDSSKYAGSVAVVDEKEKETMGILDGFGNFYITSGAEITFQIKRASSEEDPVFFEILDSDGNVIGEFYINNDLTIKRDN
ncbi:MAG: hypothetical protein OEL89_03180, partial [Candidatus Peregrinibacteria bacterium]|nr:hypothetical protein [Candidatus Peregrinibacteria bacterium]